MEDKLMTDLALSHYTREPLKFDKFREYRQPDGSDYGYAKPRGFWVSVDGEHDWATWCEDEHFNEEGLANKTAFRLKWDSQVLIIRDMDQIMEFTDRFGIQYHEVLRGIKWKLVATIYDGIIITPYLWEGRYDMKTGWYYGWDCASGCVWNLDAIEKVA